MKPFILDPFAGVLCLFLLDMGLVAGRGLGTFTGDIVRQGTMFHAARAKALAAIEATGLELGLGSEGSFGPYPFVPFIPGGTGSLVPRSKAAS